MLRIKEQQMPNESSSLDTGLGFCAFVEHAVSGLQRLRLVHARVMMREDWRPETTMIESIMVRVRV